MANTKKQMKITKLFRRGALKQIPSARLPDDCDELEDEIKQLQLRLKEKADELFESQRNSFRCKPAVSSSSRSETFVRPNKIFLTTSVESLKGNLELISMLTGMEVHSHEAEDHCCIMYHMQHNSMHKITHGVKIDLKSDPNNVSSASLPVGFNLAGVLEDFANVMSPECLCAIRSALVAYYDRLDQYEELKDLLNIEAQMFKFLDGSHMTVTFMVGHEDEEAQMWVTLTLDYRIFDIRPKLITFEDSDLPADVTDILYDQCVVFKKKPLFKAFKTAFINGNGPFKLVRKISTRPVERRRRRKQKRQPPNMHYNNDDTFRPEDTDTSDDDDDDDLQY